MVNVELSLIRRWKANFSRIRQDPNALLARTVQELQKPAVETRVCWEVGKHSLMSSYVAAIYSGEEMMGKGPGENMEVKMKYRVAQKKGVCRL